MNFDWLNARVGTIKELYDSFIQGEDEFFPFGIYVEIESEIDIFDDIDLDTVSNFQKFIRCG